MKKTFSLMLALALCVALAVPAFAVDTAGPVVVLDGGSVITFSQATTANKDIMLSRQIWYAGSALPVYTDSVRTNVNLIVTAPGCTVTRSQSATPLNLAYLSRVNAGYVVLADRFVSYPTSFTSDQLFAGALGGAELCLLTLSDGTEYYIIASKTVLVEAPALPMSYIVQAGDTLDGIALNYYGVDRLGKYLQDANPEHFEATYGILEAGRALTLPTTLNGVARLSAPLAKGNEKVYVVKAGDNLASIAKRFYGDAKYSNNIYLRNADRVKNPALIQIGQVLVLPEINAYSGVSTGGTYSSSLNQDVG